MAVRRSTRPAAQTLKDDSESKRTGFLSGISFPGMDRIINPARAASCRADSHSGRRLEAQSRHSTLGATRPPCKRLSAVPLRVHDAISAMRRCRTAGPRPSMWRNVNRAVLCHSEESPREALSATRMRMGYCASYRRYKPRLDGPLSSMTRKRAGTSAMMPFMPMSSSVIASLQEKFGNEKSPADAGLFNGAVS
jgi:hypothetical protein